MAEGFDNDFGFSLTPEVDTQKPMPETKAFVAEPVQKDITRPGAIDIPTMDKPMLTKADADKMMDDFMATNDAKAHDPMVAIKSSVYGAGLKDHQFERYYNMPRVYNKLGFTPFRDNESAYNKESSWLDEVSRASTQWANLTGLGAKDALTFGSLTDTKMAEQYEKAMAIGSSSKGGIGGFTTNLYLNSGYTVGILAEATLEELGLALITGASLGSATPLTGTAMIAAGLRAGNKITKGYEVGKNVLRTLNSLGDLNKARKYFTEATKGAGHFLNPLENTVDFVRGVDDVTKIGALGLKAKTALGFTHFYKDIRNIKYAWGESGLEGGMVRLQMEDELLQAHLDNNDGRPPTELEAKDIRETALKAGLTTGWQNVGAIYYSNKVVMDGLFDAYKPLRNLSANVIEHGPYKVLFNKAVTDPYAVVEDSWKNILKTVKNPKSYAKTGLTYFKANIAEGLQETTQEVISGAAIDHYKDEWSDNIVKGGYYASIIDNLHKQATPQGLDVFMSGFLMGGMIAPVASTMGSFIPGSKQQSFLKETYMKYFDTTTYTDLRAKQEQKANEDMNMLNDLWNSKGEALAPDLESLSKQNAYSKGMADAKDEGNSKAYYDLKDMSFFEHIQLALDKGRFDDFIDQLEEQRGFTPEEIKADSREGVSKMSQAEFVGAIDKAVERAKYIKELYDVQEDEFANPFNHKRFVEGDPRRDNEKSKEDGWRESQKKFLFANYSFQRSLERMNSIMGEAQRDTRLGKVPSADFTILFTLSDMVAELGRLKIEIGNLTGATGEQRTFLKNKEKKHKLLDAFHNDMMAVESLTKDDPQTKKTLHDAKISYGNYLKFLASTNKDHAFKDAIDKSFQKLIDHYELNKDSIALTKAINDLLDPGAFIASATRDTEMFVQKNLHAKSERERSLKEYRKVMNMNTLTQILYATVDDKRLGIKKASMFFDPDEIEPLMKDGILPTAFYYATGDAKLVRVPPYTPDWQQAMNYVQEYVTNIMGIPIEPLSEKRVEKMKAFNTEARAKSVEDVRTYHDLAKQFGFDPFAAETVLSLKQVLETIIKSEEATVQEVELANELLRRATDSETVTFTNDTDEIASYGTTKQTVINAHHGASNYQNNGYALEFLILHAEIQRRTQDALNTDLEFKAAVTRIQTTVKNHFKANTEASVQEPVGLGSLEDFVAEAMTNSKFQSLLAQVPYDVTGQSTWKTFVQSVMALLKKYFTKKNSNNALTEAFYIITTKIDAGSTIASSKTPISKATATPTGTNVKITQSTPVEDIIKLPTITEAGTNKTYNLADMLLELYKTDNDKRKLDKVALRDPDYTTKSDVALLESAQFDSFISELTPSVQKIFALYNEKASRNVAPTPKPSSSGGITIMTIEMKDWLTAHGFNPSDYNVAQAEALIKQNLSKQELLDREIIEAMSRQQIIDNERKEKQDEIAAEIAAENHYDKLDLLEQDLFRRLKMKDEESGLTLEAITGWSYETIGKLIELKKTDIAFTYTFEDIKPNMVVIMKGSKEDQDGEKLVIDKIVGGIIKAHKLSNPNVFRTIKKADVHAKIKYVFKEEMLKPDVKKPTIIITQQDEELANDTQATTKAKIADKAALKAKIDKVKNAGKKSGRFTDNINDKC